MKSENKTEGPSSNKNVTVVSTVKKPRLKLKLTKQRSVIILVLVLVITGLFLATVYYQRSKNKPVVNSPVVISKVCSEEILKEASQALDKSQVQQLEPINQKIRGLQDYDKDPNCLYVVLVFYINYGDAINANKYLAEYEKLYSINQNISAQLKGRVESIEILKQNVSFLTDLTNQIQQNSKKFAEPTQ